MYYVKVKFQLEPDPVYVMLKGEGNTDMYSHPTHLWFEPGQHRIHFRADGYARVTTEFEAHTPGRVQILQVKLRPADNWLLSAPGGLSPQAKRELGTPAEWAAFGSGVALAGLGAACSIRAAMNRDNLNDVPRPGVSSTTSPEYLDYVERRGAIWDSDVRPWQRASYIFYGLGGSVMLTSLIFIFTPETDNAATSVSVSALPQPGGGTLGFAGSF